MPLLRYRTTFPRPDRSVVAAFDGLPVANVSDVLGPGHLLPFAIRPLRPGMRLLGPALPVNLPAGDNLAMHKAIALLQPGDVIVADQVGTPLAAPFGEILATAALARGVAGLVINGVVRDSARLAEMLPVFALGAYAAQCNKNGGGSVGIPLVCGDATVHAGDLVVGDDDGIVVVPQARAAEIADKARAKSAGEARRLADIAAGRLYPDWLDGKLAECGEVEVRE